jgi:hypothetical protein
MTFGESWTEVSDADLAKVMHGPNIDGQWGDHSVKDILFGDGLLTIVNKSDLPKPAAKLTTSDTASKPEAKSDKKG